MLTKLILYLEVKLVFLPFNLYWSLNYWMHVIYIITSNIFIYAYKVIYTVLEVVRL